MILSEAEKQEILRCIEVAYDEGMADPRFYVHIADVFGLKAPEHMETYAKHVDDVERSES